MRSQTTAVRLSLMTRRLATVDMRAYLALSLIIAVTLTVLTAPVGRAEPADRSPDSLEAPEAPSGSTEGPVALPNTTPVSPAIAVAPIESFTPSSHSVTRDGETTLELFGQPAFRRDADGWQAIDTAITPGQAPYAFEALGLVNPVHFGSSPESLLTIDTIDGPVVFSLPGGDVRAPELRDGVVLYRDVFPGVDLEFRTSGGRVGKHFVIHDVGASTVFDIEIADPLHSLGIPARGANESWSFSSAVAFGTGIEFPAPAAWSQGSDGVGLPGSAHQTVTTTSDGYTVTVSADSLWLESAEFPVVLDPAIQWTDELWEDNDGLLVAFGPTGSDDCGGDPCHLADPVDGLVTYGSALNDSTGEMDYFLTYVGADLAALSDRQVSSAVLGGYDYWTDRSIAELCAPIGVESTGFDLLNALCSPQEPLHTEDFYKDGLHWRVDVTGLARAAANGSSEMGSLLGLVMQPGEHNRSGQVPTPVLRLVYTGYPVPRPLTEEQTFGCDCWAGHSSANQAYAADPVNTATGALIEQFEDLTVGGIGIPITMTRTYNSLDTRTTPFGPGWSFSYGASLTEDPSGALVLVDGSGTRTRFGAVVGDEYAPLDPAVSANLERGSDGTFVASNLAGASMTFAASGELLASVNEQGQGLEFGYVGGHLTTVTDEVGQVLTYTWDSGPGAEARIVAAQTSDGRSVGYGYALVAGQKRLVSVTAVDGATTTYGYAPNGGLSSITDPLGHVSARNTYGSDGRISSQRDETGARTTFEWNEATQTATVTDPTGRVRIDVYSGLNLVKQIDADGNTVEFFYDGDNYPVATVDASNTLFRTEYDEQGRLILRVAPAPFYYTETWTYGEYDHVTSYTDPEGFTTEYTYNSAGLVHSVTNPDGGVFTYVYTTELDGVPPNLVKSATDSLGRTTSYSYNQLGELVSTQSPGGRVMSWTYDAQHRVQTSTAPGGEVTSFTYDAAGRRVTETDPSGAVTTYAYDAAGRLVSTTDALGRATRFFYDRADRLIRSRDAEGHNSYTSYDGAGRVASTTDALGGVTTYSYDQVGRLVATTDPLGRTSAMEYDELGQLVARIDPAGGVTTYEYDVLGRLTAQTDPDGIVFLTSYDKRGNVTSVADGAGGFTQTSYDAMGRPVTIMDSDGVYTTLVYDLAGQVVAQRTARSSSEYVPGYFEDEATFDYDADGLLTASVDPRGNVPGSDPSVFTTTLTYDANGRVTTSTDALGRTTLTEYDLVGRPVAVTAPDGDVTSTTYNALGWITSVRAPGQGRTRYTYDRVGNVIARMNALGNVTSYEYDALDRLVAETDPLGRETTLTYDAAGQVVQVVTPTGTATADDGSDGAIVYSYDGAGRLVNTTFSDDTADFAYTYSAAGRVLQAARVNGGEVLASSLYGYDELGRVTSVTRTGPGGGEASYSYTSAGRVSGVAWSTGMSASYDYNSAGQVVTVDPSGPGDLSEVNYAYDAAGHVTGVIRTGAATPLTTQINLDAAGQLTSLTHSAAGVILQGYDIARDVNGAPTTVTRSEQSHVSTAVYTYDTAGRLRSECYPLVGATCSADAERMSYTYDQVGNRLTMSERYTYDGVTETYLTEYAYDSADQLVSLSQGGTLLEERAWTLNGTLASISWDGGSVSYVSDMTDELVSTTDSDGSEVSFTVDALGNRTSRSVDGVVDATWAWDEVLGLPTRVGEYSADGSAERLWLPDVVSSTGSSLAEVNSVAPVWLLPDPFANVAGAVAMGGTALAGSRFYSAFGEYSTGAPGTLGVSPLGFSGQFREMWTGLYDMRARDYDASLGTFTAIDPVAVQTGSPYVGPYVYGMNSPLVFIDPSGMTACGPSGSDCNGANLVGVFRDLERAQKDTAYLSLYNSLTAEQISEIPFDAMQYIHAESANRQMHLDACEASPAECWEPCPEQSYQACQLERGAIGFAVYFAAPMALGMGFSAMLSRACAADAAALATRTVTTQAETAVAANTASAESIVVGSRTYIDLTRGGSIRNVGTDATHAEFAETLTQNGWASRLSSDGAVQIFEQNGARYVLRQRADSYSGWSADFTPAGSAGVTLKLRLGYE